MESGRQIASPQNPKKKLVIRKTRVVRIKHNRQEHTMYFDKDVFEFLNTNEIRNNEALLCAQIAKQIIARETNEPIPKVIYAGRISHQLTSVSNDGKVIKKKSPPQFKILCLIPPLTPDDVPSTKFIRNITLSEVLPETNPEVMETEHIPNFDLSLLQTSIDTVKNEKQNQSKKFYNGELNIKFEEIPFAKTSAEHNGKQEISLTALAQMSPLLRPIIDTIQQAKATSQDFKQLSQEITDKCQQYGLNGAEIKKHFFPNLGTLESEINTHEAFVKSIETYLLSDELKNEISNCVQAENKLDDIKRHLAIALYNAAGNYYYAIQQEFLNPERANKIEKFNNEYFKGFVTVDENGILSDESLLLQNICKKDLASIHKLVNNLLVACNTTTGLTSTKLSTLQETLDSASKDPILQNSFEVSKKSVLTLQRNAAFKWSDKTLQLEATLHQANKTAKEKFDIQFTEQSQEDFVTQVSLTHQNLISEQEGMAAFQEYCQETEILKNKKDRIKIADLEMDQSKKQFEQISKNIKVYLHELSSHVGVEAEKAHKKFSETYESLDKKYQETAKSFLAKKDEINNATVVLKRELRLKQSSGITQRMTNLLTDKNAAIKSQEDLLKLEIELSTHLANTRNFQTESFKAYAKDCYDKISNYSIDDFDKDFLKGKAIEIARINESKQKISEINTAASILEYTQGFAEGAKELNKYLTRIKTTYSTLKNEQQAMYFRRNFAHMKLALKPISEELQVFYEIKYAHDQLKNLITDYQHQEQVLLNLCDNINEKTDYAELENKRSTQYNELMDIVNQIRSMMPYYYLLKERDIYIEEVEKIKVVNLQNKINKLSDKSQTDETLLKAIKNFKHSITTYDDAMNLSKPSDQYPKYAEGDLKLLRSNIINSSNAVIENYKNVIIRINKLKELENREIMKNQKEIPELVEIQGEEIRSQQPAEEIQSQQPPEELNPAPVEASLGHRIKQFCKNHWGKMLGFGIVAALIVVTGVLTGGVVPAIAAAITGGTITSTMAGGIAVGATAGAGLIVGAGLGIAAGHAAGGSKTGAGIPVLDFLKKHKGKIIAGVLIGLAVVGLIILGIFSAGVIPAIAAGAGSAAAVAAGTAKLALIGAIIGKFFASSFAAIGVTLGAKTAMIAGVTAIGTTAVITTTTVTAGLSNIVAARQNVNKLARENQAQAQPQQQPGPQENRRPTHTASEPISIGSGLAESTHTRLKKAFSQETTTHTPITQSDSNDTGEIKFKPITQSSSKDTETAIKAEARNTAKLRLIVAVSPPTETEIAMNGKEQERKTGRKEEERNTGKEEEDPKYSPPPSPKSP